MPPPVRFLHQRPGDIAWIGSQYAVFSVVLHECRLTRPLLRDDEAWQVNSFYQALELLDLRGRRPRVFSE